MRKKALQKQSKKDLSNLSISQKEEEKLKRKARKYSVVEGCGYGVMEGAGLKNITPFSLAIGASTTAIGILSSVPALLGNIAQIPLLKLQNRFSRKAIVIWGAILQAIMWLFLILVGYFYFNFGASSDNSVMFLIITYSLLTIFGSATNPMWNSWMKDIVPKKFGEYFGVRNRIIGFVSLISLLATGFLLDYYKNTKLFVGFFIIFFVCFIARIFSVYYLKKQHEPKFVPNEHKFFTFRQFLKKMPYNNFGRFVIFVSLIQLSVAIASAYFAVHMLSSLKFSYVQFTIISLIVPAATLVFMPWWGKFSDKYGNFSVLKLCGGLLFIPPLYWIFVSYIFNSNTQLVFYSLIPFEVFSGFIWAGFNLAIANFIFDAVTKERMQVCVAYYNILTSFGTVVGAVIGGLIANTGFFIFGMSSLLFVFLLSAILRLLVFLLMIGKLKEVRDVKEFGFFKFQK